MARASPYLLSDFPQSLSSRHPVLWPYAALSFVACTAWGKTISIAMENDVGMIGVLKRDTTRYGFIQRSSSSRMHPFVGALLSPILLATLFARFSYAAPWASPAKHATHRVRTIGRDLKIEAYHPKSSFKVISQVIRARSYLSSSLLQIYGKGTESPSFKVKGSDLKVSMASFIASELGVDSSAIGYHSGRSEDVMSYWYGKQYHASP